MERTSASRSTTTPRCSRRGHDRHLLAKEATDAICKMVFEDGFFHADRTRNLFGADGGSRSSTSAWWATSPRSSATT
ncbi:hypothetical protein QJS66_03370 [Kocuria rhizophila]|nr:hypothetical protein QJS66_03370 [Kocuria rhizophila]